MKCRLLSVIARAHKRKPVFHTQKLEGCRGEIPGSQLNTTLPLESGKISDTNSVDKNFSLSIFWGQLTIWIYMYDPISVTIENPVIRCLSVEPGDFPSFSQPQNCATTTVNHTLFNSEAFTQPKFFSLKAQQTAQRVLKVERSRPSSGTRLTHYHKLNVNYNLYGTAFIFQLRFWYARSWTRQGTYNCVSRKYRVIKRLCAPDGYSTTTRSWLMISRWPSENIFGMFLVITW